ncbi:PIN domain nuclease [Aphanothece hegewaldii CCALA 016]|uniref:PIN domain nuclease n=1 Tax=Aphanothece hegewaldii CCALA 016 TaxID=2107694 RepID=A0A2T1LR11_9CHRO|nr:type II toxin-antitoxin system VapC family toxin [Aphanothece hegewaldii]PSF30033.1 PIN domain nuclease [Aphanothece hegewaldii CCALA 016]
MIRDSFCLDTSVFIKYLCPDEQEESATFLVEKALNTRIVLPCFAWAEVAKVLRKKVRSGLLSSDEASQLYQAFGDLPIEYIDAEDIRVRSWELALSYDLLTLYDSVFLAVAEKESAQYWTADGVLLKALNPKPSYVFELSS